VVRNGYARPRRRCMTMTAWRVTYLPESTSATRTPVTVTIEDPASPSLGAFVSRLSSGELGIEWAHGRDIRSVQVVESIEHRHRRRLLTALLAVLVAGFMLTGVAALRFDSGSPLYEHPWSGTAYTGASCGEGCFSQPLAESFPNGSYVTGTWTASEPAVVFIQTSSGELCPGGSPSGFFTNGSCSEPGVTSGTFGFSSVGGPVYFVIGSQGPQNVAVSGYWSTSWW